MEGDKYTDAELAACVGMISKGISRITGDEAATTSVPSLKDDWWYRGFTVISIPEYDKIRHLKLTKIVMDLE